MKHALSNLTSLWNALKEAGDLSGRYLIGAETSIALNEFVEGSALFGRGDELGGRSVLLAMQDQLTTASALVELDGVARRIVLCPPDLPLDHFPHIIDTAEIDAIVSDRSALQLGKPRPMYFGACSRKIVPGNHNGSVKEQTEWVLLTSGTTGLPKLVAHTLESLAGAIDHGDRPDKPIVWSTFYDIRRYGGLQIFLRAVLTGSSLVLSSGQESTADYLARAAASGVTHISGTPSQWRRALMSSSTRLIDPRYVRLSGEVVDQAILTKLRSVYPPARLVHAFASTEAGVAIEVHDGASGFPIESLSSTPGVEMKVEEGTLRIRSQRTASRYLGERAPQLKGEDGFVDTSDIVEVRDGRCYFAGRRDGIINVGGLKVHPEEIEAVINRHPEVQMSVVRSKKSPVTGALVVADVVLKPETANVIHDLRAIQDDILLHCRESLSSHKVPAAINVVASLAIAESGKVMRRNA
jgi:acyl-coenzyme A synthetase/AMP-(fatty) acid ligase